MTIKFIIFFLISESTSTPFSIPLLAGMSARVLSVTVVNPLELVRTKMQSEKLNYFRECDMNVNV